ncbi:MAG: cation diffusion facilitator family transporter [Flavobacteriaceae bacterium]|nr:cation diffusion facilitator family transporter [Flavobacteriaceae bacterium]
MGVNHHNKPTVSGKNLLFSILLHLLITIAQFIGGVISGSLALISDSIHNFSDVISLIVSYIANILAQNKKQTIRKTFGYKRAEIIAAFFNATTLIVIALILGYEAIQRFFSPVEIESNLVIGLAFLGILVNGFSVLLLKKDAAHNLNMKSAYIHLLADMLTSVAVLTGGLLMKFYQIYWIDSILTLLISIYLIKMSWKIFIDSLHILLMFVPKNIVVEEVVATLCDIEIIKNIHHVHIWQLNEQDVYFDAHISFKEDITLSNFDVICKKIEHILHDKFDINHCNLQPEYIREDLKEIIIQD